MKLFKFSSSIFTKKILTLIALSFLSLSVLSSLLYYKTYNSQVTLNIQLSSTKKELDDLKSQDQIKINQTLQEEIKNINKNYKDSVSGYEKIQDLKAQKQDTSKLDAVYAQIVKFLADKNYASASATLADLNKAIDEQNAKLAAATAPQSGSTQATANALQSNTPPGSGYSLQKVDAEGSSYNVSIIAADLNSTKVIIDTASDSDCSNNCPTLPLATYVSRSGAYAGINGSFFCPPEYPSCAGRTGSFDTLLMNKNKHYFNSDNNVYSTVPAAIFYAGGARFVSQSLQWGRDTSPDGVIANYPLLVSGGNIVYTEPANEPKFGQKGSRSFIAVKGSTVYIGVVYSATMGESAKVMHALGMGEALNLDEGGSTALWSGGYITGPGRNIPNAVLFARR